MLGCERFGQIQAKAAVFPCLPPASGFVKQRARRLRLSSCLEQVRKIERISSTRAEYRPRELPHRLTGCET
jgi:hypothetical protein